MAERNKTLPIRYLTSVTLVKPVEIIRGVKQDITVVLLMNTKLSGYAKVS